MMRTAQLDPRLGLRIVASRTLTYDTTAEPHDDRPAHVRAGSGLALHAGRLVVIQDDASFFGIVTPDGVSAQKLPRGLDGRRRFEVAIGNKLDKLDLESCVAIDDELWAFGSGSLPIRDKLCRVSAGISRVIDAGPLYARFREALNGVLNLEGAARVVTGELDELWLFHRGNCGSTDPGPAVIRVRTAALRAWVAATAPMPAIVALDGYALGGPPSGSFGFTDAVAIGDQVLYLACAEASPNAVDDGAILGSQLGVIHASGVRCAPLSAVDGSPIKAEGIAFDPQRPDHLWVVADPDDTEQPAILFDVELTGPWLTP
jgi:hypothetical protein